MLLNQTHVRFSSGSLEQVAYSNTVQTPLIGPLLTASKHATPDQLTLGQTVTYTLTIANEGNRDAQVTVFDALPEGLAFIPNSVLRDGSPIPGSKPATGISVGTVAVGATVQLVFQAIMIAIPNTRVFVNQAHLAYRFATQEGRVVTEAVQSNPVTTAAVPFQLHAYAQLSSVVTFIGDALYYDVILKNEGLEPIDHTSVATPLPAGFAFVPGSVIMNDVHAAWIDPTAGIPVGTIAPGATVSIRVGLRVNGTPASAKTIIQSVVQYAVNNEPYSTDTNSVEVIVIAPSVSVGLTTNRLTAPVGSKVTYEAVITNGSSFAVDAVLSDLLPKGTTYVPDSLRMNGNIRRGGTISNGIPLGTLLAGSRTVITYQVLIPPATEAAGLQPILNRVRVTYTFRLPDGRVIEQFAQSNTEVTNLIGPILSITASAHPAEFVIDESIYYSFIVSNTGNWDADVTFYRSAYPPGFELRNPRVNGASVAYFSADEGLSLGLLPPDASIRVAYLVFCAELDDWEHYEVATRCMARYVYEYDGSSYSGICEANELVIPIEEQDE
ncbi:DUF11 domain-containing protein [Paenibacillus curdlanolyticus]|nr:DUF11 domain-containing protein [Paenibacillus curdlanolyticus]